MLNYCVVLQDSCNESLVINMGLIVHGPMPVEVSVKHSSVVSLGENFVQLHANDVQFFIFFIFNPFFFLGT